MKVHTAMVDTESNSSMYLALPFLEVTEKVDVIDVAENNLVIIT